MSRSGKFTLSILQILGQTAILLFMSPSPFDQPSAPSNMFIYGIVAFFILLAWNNRPTKHGETT